MRKKSKITKKIRSIFLAVCIMIVSIPVPVYAEKNEGSSGIKIDIRMDQRYVYSKKEEVWSKLKEEGFALVDKPAARIDLMEDEEYKNYMPPIKRQNGGTCTAFSTVYYQYSYEVNRLNKVQSREEAEMYSPYDVFSYVYDKPKDKGCSEWNMQLHLKEHGAVSWNEFPSGFMEVVDVDPDAPIDCAYFYTEDVPAMRYALGTRIEHFYEYWETYDDGIQYKMIDEMNEKLEIAKRLLSSGNVLVTSIGSSYYTSKNCQKGYAQGSSAYIAEDGQEEYEVVYRMGSGITHSVAIVGYDDTAWFDVNNNRSKDAGEIGAFKVVDSWGTMEHNNKGYFWVLYDAVVNKVPALEGTGQAMDIPQISLKKEKNSSGNEEYFLYVNGDAQNRTNVANYDFKEFLKELSGIPEIDGKYNKVEFRKVMEEIYGGLDSTQAEELDKWFDKKRGEWKNKLDKYVEAHNCFPKNWDEVLRNGEGDRQRMFSQNDNENWYMFIKVKKYDVSVVGQVEYSLGQRQDYQLSFSKSNADQVIAPIPRNGTADPIEATEVFDLTDLTEGENSLFGEQQWKVGITLTNGNTCDYFNFKLFDDCEREIPTKVSHDTGWQDTGGGNKYREITLTTNLKPCDINYDGYITKHDLERTRDFFMDVYGNWGLWKRLVDYNNDGVLNGDDIDDVMYDAYQYVYTGSPSGFRLTEDELYSMMGDLGWSDMGDENLDGKIDMRDVALLETMLNGGSYSKKQRMMADVNQDGQMDERDLQKLVNNVCFRDINGDGRYTEDDIREIHDELVGMGSMTAYEKEFADLNGNGKIDAEDENILAYGFYKNVSTNPDCDLETFWGTICPLISIYAPGDINCDGKYDEMDVRLLKQTIEGKPLSYRFYITGDVNRDTVVDEKDWDIYMKQYMSDIPFTYTLDSAAKTMTITGVKDKNAEFLDIASSYCVNGQTYSVTALGQKAFTSCDNVMTIYIPETVVTIPGTRKEYSPFYGLDSSRVKINCEAASVPSGFGWNWNAGLMYELGYEMKNAADYFTFIADEASRTLTLTGLKDKWHVKGDNVYMDERYLVNGEEYTVTKIADEAFYGEWCSCDNIYLPATLEEIGSSAFEYNVGVEYVDLTRCRKLKKIGSRAFAENCYMEGLYITAGVTVIEADTPEDSIVWNCDICRMYIVAETSETGNTWGRYWNYIDGENRADTLYTMD